MKKIVAKTKVYWDSGDGREMTGIVKQIHSDHVLVSTDKGEYLVRKAVLKTKTVTRG